MGLMPKSPRTLSTSEDISRLVEFLHAEPPDAFEAPSMAAKLKLGQRLLPRSPVLRQSEGGDGGLSLADMMHQGIDSVTASASSESEDLGTDTRARRLHSPPLGAPVKRLFLQPRSPTVHRTPPILQGIHEQVLGLTQSGTPAQGNVMPRSFSLQEMLDSDPPTVAEPSSSNLLRSTTESSDPNMAELPARQRHRKRWSLLDGLRFPPSPVMGTESIDTPAALNTTTSRSLSPAVEQRPHQSTAGGLLNSTMSTSTLTEQPVSALAQPSMAMTVAPLPAVKPRPAYLEGEESPPYDNLPVETGEASSHPDGAIVTFTQANGTTVGPATKPPHVRRADQAGAADSLGPLDYVKLARTTGSSFIRASETTKRTYLAVLCGEHGEKIELFTVSLACAFP